MDECKDSKVYRCEACGIEFEAGVSDPGPGGKARCPQCGLSEATEVGLDNACGFVVRRTTRFR